MKFIKESTPILPVRLAESILGLAFSIAVACLKIIAGRLNATQLVVVIPAHFLGCIFGTAVVCSVIPFNISQVMLYVCLEMLLLF